jgi:hypothetical protein
VIEVVLREMRPSQGLDRGAVGRVLQQGGRGRDTAAVRVERDGGNLDERAPLPDLEERPVAGAGPGPVDADVEAQRRVEVEDVGPSASLNQSLIALVFSLASAQRLPLAALMNSTSGPR